MRDLFVSGLIVGCLPTCFRRPFIGLLLYYMLRPADSQIARG